MNELAYDISYLLESEPAEVEAVPELRAARAPRAARSSRAGIVAAQEAMARELGQFAEAHEEWIRQYLRVQGSVQSSP